MADETALSRFSTDDAFSRHGAAEPRPMLGYGLLAGAFVAAGGAALALTPTSRLQRNVSLRDVVLLGVATGMLARLVALDAVNAPLRAAFTEYEGPSGAGEVHERPRGTGLRRAMGELLTCPFCVAPWASAALFTALAHRPRTTRWIASALASMAIANMFNQAYARMRELS